jgi:hypothetical protein
MQASKHMLVRLLADPMKSMTIANGGAPFDSIRFISTNSPDRLGDGDGTDGEA